MKVCHICLVIIHLFVFFDSPKMSLILDLLSRFCSIGFLRRTFIHSFSRNGVWQNRSLMWECHTWVPPGQSWHLFQSSHPCIHFPRNIFSLKNLLLEYVFPYRNNFSGYIGRLFSSSIGTFFPVLEEHCFHFLETRSQGKLEESAVCNDFLRK